jgi:preprotein translocase subunit SecF
MTMRSFSPDSLMQALMEIFVMDRVIPYRVQVDFNTLPKIDEVRAALDRGGLKGYSLQSQPQDNSIVVRVKGGDGNEAGKESLGYDIVNLLSKDFSGNVKATPGRVEFIGPVIGKTLVMNAYKAIFGSLAVILIYVAIRFKKWIWGTAGVLALGHDVFLAWALLTLIGHETTLVVVAALLTLAGYSINDTIVVFDRVRENLRNARKENAADLYNRSLNETLGRTINTSLTTFIAALCLYFLGGDVIHDFALVMSFGVFIGTFSSVGVALSLVYTLESRAKK